MRVRQFLCALSTVVVTAALVGMPAVAQPASAQPSQAAQRQAGPVEVGELTTEDRIVHQQPDGSMLATLNVEPVRVKQDGRWNPVDTTLMRLPDGSFGARAIPSDLALSPGGAGPLVRLGKGSKSVALSWPGKLPAPVIAGDTATYPEVLPGVDLLMRAEAKGVCPATGDQERGGGEEPGTAPDQARPRDHRRELEAGRIRGVAGT